MDLTGDDVLNLTRLGKKNPEAERPLRVILRESTKKDEVFRNIRKLGESEYKDISIKNDLTKLERAEDKKLVAEAKTMQENDPSGDWKFKVRGPPWNRKIVRLSKE